MDPRPEPRPTRLGRVADPAALDAAVGPRARLEICIPREWLRDGADIEIAAPRMLPCDRCGGGGCDGCARSGAFRTHPDEGGRTLSATLPASDQGMVLRLVSPFEGSEIEQLMLRVELGDTASKQVRLRERPVLDAPRPQLWWNPTLAIVALLVFIALVLLTWRYLR